MNTRRLTSLDRLITQLDQGMRTVFGKPNESGSSYPGAGEPDIELSAQEKALSRRLMRVNHAGEIAAQALYQGQALSARTGTVRIQMERAAEEENAHLGWCETRLKELDGRVSLLNPLWYVGSLAIGALAGRTGDKWNLGFVAETERQVVRHLNEHLARLPGRDNKSRKVLEQMRADEAQHATLAIKSGAAPLPAPVEKLMSGVSKIMTGTAYWI